MDNNNNNKWWSKQEIFADISKTLSILTIYLFQQLCVMFFNSDFFLLFLESLQNNRTILKNIWIKNMMHNFRDKCSEGKSLKYYQFSNILLMSAYIFSLLHVMNQFFLYKLIRIIKTTPKSCFLNGCSTKHTVIVIIIIMFIVSFIIIIFTVTFVLKIAVC